MSIWTTKSLSNRDRNYVVLQHSLKGVNYVISGVKFRDGYAVVEKDSKTHYMLKRVPVLRSAKEFPLTHLRNLSFITRILDIKTVFGQDVYRRFLEEEEKERQSQALAAQTEQEHLEQLSVIRREEDIKLSEQIQKVIDEAKANGESQETINQLQDQLPTIEKCTYRVKDGNLCGQKAYEDSPAKYCHHHIFQEPALKTLGIVVPELMTKKERKALREKIEAALSKAKKKGEI